MTRKWSYGTLEFHEFNDHQVRLNKTFYAQDRLTQLDALQDFVAILQHEYKRLNDDKDLSYEDPNPKQNVISIEDLPPFSGHM